MAHDVETVIIGAGVVGLAIARQLASDGHDVLILEQKQLFGSETSARNSEVIHAGIYYPKNSLKAQLCTRGKALLYAYCEKHNVGHKRVGKIIVATNEEQTHTLQSIKNKAADNGVTDLETLSAKQLRKLEPEITATAGLLSPSTGILDSHGFMLSLLGVAESHGAMIAYNSVVERIDLSTKKANTNEANAKDAIDKGKSKHSAANDGFTLSVSGSSDLQLSCKNVINAAGHGAPVLAQSTYGLDKKHVPSAVFSKGNYFRLQASKPVDRLVYPVPEPGGLGVHITMDMAGQCRFGPDVQMQDSLNYEVDMQSVGGFYNAIRRYWPALPDNSLVPDYAGVRPKIEFNGEPYNDFVLQGSATHGISGLVNLFGIESPGLTSSLAIAEHVSVLLKET